MLKRKPQNVVSHIVLRGAENILNWKKEANYQEMGTTSYKTYLKHSLFCWLWYLIFSLEER